MKLLFVSHTVVGDRSFGGAIRANALRDALTEMGSVDTLIVNLGADAIDDEWREGRIRFASMGEGARSVRGWWRVRSWIAALVDRERYDAIVVQYIDLAILIPWRFHDRTIFDADDFRKTVAPGHSRSKRLKYAVRNRMAEWIASRVRHSWLVSPLPTQRPRSGSNSILPNIVPLPAPDRTRGTPVPGRLLMVGFMQHAPNADGLAWFYDHVWPTLKARVPDISLHVVGRHAEDLPARMPDVVFKGFVERLEQEYDAAQLVIAPIFTGAGTQIKVIDALGHQRPLIASSFAHSGFAAELKDGEHLRVAREPASWVDGIVALLTHPDQAKAMAARGMEAVRRSFGDQVMKQEVARTIESIIATNSGKKA